MESTPSAAQAKQPQTSAENAGAGNFDPSARTLGNFRIVRLLGRGGMGEVYLAEQTSLKRNVALKLLRPDLAADDQYIQRFKAEAMAVAKIMHPNIVSVFEIGEQDGVHFIAFEYVQGTNLRDYLQKKGTLDLPTFLSIVGKVAAALERAGDEGIVHRDIKPENILLTKKGEVKVADFGLARQLGHDRVELTQSGMTMGTPLYMSPEQVEGKPVDQRSDLYSLGVMAYHMLAGEPPFRGATAIAIAIQHLNTKPVDLATLCAEVPSDYIAVIDKLMAKNVADRYQSVRDLLRDLNRLRNQQQIEPAFTVSADETALRTDPAPIVPTGATAALRSTMTQLLGIVGRRRYRPWLVAGSLVCGLALGAGIGWLRREPALPVLSGTSNSAFAIPSTAGVERQTNSALQLLHAVNVLPEEQVEAGLWAVIEHFAGAEIETIDAATRLFERYLKRRQYELALAVADRMSNRENLAQKMVGGLFQGIVESRQGNASKSNQSFLEVFEKGKTQSRDVFLANERLDWLFRQYVLAIRVNFERLAKPLDERMIEDFWNAFKPLAAKRK